nr:DALR anticodon-binding domain-containing protein [Streptomyces sp. SBE_14.2]
MTPVELSRTVLRAVRRAVDQGELRVDVPERAVVTVPGPGGCGDYATNVALQLARPAGEPPLRVAEILRQQLVGDDLLDDVVVTGPGFLNFRLRGSGLVTGLVEEILRDGARYGFSEQLGGQVVHLHAPCEVRAVVVMDSVGRLLRSQGARVQLSCDSPPPEEPAEWENLLGGVRVGHGSEVAVPTTGPPAAGPVRLRPVPAPSDPLPLGPDAARWALLHPAPHDRPRITDEHLVQREANPLFRVRYAHARTRALTRNAADLGFASEPGPVSRSAGAQDHSRNAADLGFASGPGPIGRTAADHGFTGEPGPIGRTAEARALTRNAADLGFASEPGPVGPHLQDLVSALADHPRILLSSATRHTPDRLARHLVDVADAALALLPAVLPRGAEKPSAAHRARLALAEAAGAVLAGGLSLLGIDAPEHL